MSFSNLFEVDQPQIVAALHLPALPGSCHPNAQPWQAIVDYTLRNAGIAVKAGVPALYIQDLGDYPWSPVVEPHTVAMLSVLGELLKRAFPSLVLGVCLMSHGGREPLAIAQACGAQFVRIKTYIGAMVRMEGMVQGCAYEAITYRAQRQAEHIAILADVYDRSGEPLGRLALPEAATQAAVYGRADGLILTGHNFVASLEMLSEVREAKLGVPLLLGGSCNAENVAQALEVADGAIVSTGFKIGGGWTHAGIAADWDYETMVTFMEAARGTQRARNRAV